MKARLMCIGLMALAGGFSLTSCTAPSELAGAQAMQSLQKKFQSGQDVRLLWIGNSYSFGVPRQVERMANAAGGKVHCEQVTYSGWSLARHARHPETRCAIRSRAWDAVILQEQSLLPSTLFERWWKSRPAVASLAREIRKAGAQPMLYQTWAYLAGDPQRDHDHFSRMNQRLRSGYHSYGHAFGIPIVPVGDAWELQIKANGGISLFLPDGRHPSSDGDALSAKIFMIYLFGIKSTAAK